VAPEVDPSAEMDVSEEMVPEVNLPDEIDGSVDRTVNWVLASPDDFEMEDQQTRLHEAHLKWCQSRLTQLVTSGVIRGCRTGTYPLQSMIRCPYSMQSTSGF
jgi:hypothetical protein